MKLNIVGSIFGIDGYNAHCKQLAGALYELNPDIKLDVPLPPDWMRNVNDAELVMISKENRVPDVTIAITTPPNWRSCMNDNSKFVGVCVWEGDVIPLFWTEYLFDRNVDMIFVPSNHTKNAIINTLKINKDILNDKDIENIINKIRIVPHGVSQSIFNPK